jgi:hypothetical protein
MTKTNRNQPCPCGSGKKYKACHGSTDQTRGGLATSKWLAIVVGIIVIGGAAILLNEFRTADLSSDTGTPEPYEYNPATNHYWDPAHNHWHEGRPPAQAQAPGQVEPPAQAPPLPIEGIENAQVVSAEEAARRLAERNVEAGPGETPAAWEYDADNDRHWNPNSGAWEQGMPPLEAFTSDGN